MNEERELIVSTVRRFVEKEVIPVASELEHRNEYPHELVRQMQAMGLFGLNIPEQYGGANVDTTTFAMVFEEISRGWLGLAGVIGSHSVMCDVLVRFGTAGTETPASCPRWPPAKSAAESASANPAPEPTSKTWPPSRFAQDDEYRINGSKMWITNARHGNTFLLLAKTDPVRAAAVSRHERLHGRERRARPHRRPGHRQAGL